MISSSRDTTGNIVIIIFLEELCENVISGDFLEYIHGLYISIYTLCSDCHTAPQANT